jgi:hypothetical protein
MNDELERSWEQAVFKVLARHSPGRTEENNESLSQDSQSPSRDLKIGPLEYEAGVLTAQPRQSVI